MKVAPLTSILSRQLSTVSCQPENQNEGRRPTAYAFGLSQNLLVSICFSLIINEKHMIFLPSLGGRWRGAAVTDEGHPPHVHSLLSTVNCQLSTVNCQLSTVNCQLSAGKPKRKSPGLCRSISPGTYPSFCILHLAFCIFLLTSPHFSAIINKIDTTTKGTYQNGR